MFALQEAFRNFIRNRNHSILLLLIAAMLCGCMAFYLGNIRTNQAALEQLAMSTPVKVSVSDSSGMRTSELKIDQQHIDSFTSSPYLKDFHIGATAFGALGDEARAQSPFLGGDATVIGVNCEDAIWMPDGVFTYADGYDERVFSSSDSVCLMNKVSMAEQGLSIGDSATVAVHLVHYDQNGIREFAYIGDQPLKIVGTTSSAISPHTFMVPVLWMKKATEEAGIDFSYSFCEGYMKDPRQINAFKASIEGLDFLEPDPNVQNYYYSGTALSVDDKTFFTTAEKIGQSILVFKQFLVPFFGLVVLLIMLTIFLVLRGSRHDMAIAVSLGRPKALTALTHFLAALAAEFIGCILALPVMVCISGLSIMVGSTVCGAFLICACLGNALGLALILRFDVLNMLTAVE